MNIPCEHKPKLLRIIVVKVGKIHARADRSRPDSFLAIYTREGS